MKKLAFVTDSGSGFSKAYWEKEGIYSVPLQLDINGQSAEDYETVLPADIVENLKQQVPMKTSLPSLGAIEDLFEELKAQGYDGVFAIPICQGLSGTLNAMELAARNQDLEFTGFDTGSTAVLQAYCIRQAKKMYDAGKDIPEILEFLNKVCDKADTILLVDDLQHMKRGGRLTASAALLGGLLKIKPVLHDNRETDGKVDVLGKVRTMSKAQGFVIDRLKSLGAGPGWDVTVAHVGVPQPAEAYAARIREAIPGITTRIIDLVSAVAVHTGLGCLAVQAFDPQGELIEYDLTKA
ncbi:DegV family protein [uncultured Faecalibaculum sp.]|uniref:DegV family protein n=1 Tax=uncultured Faecalibaculum sp. TaxID=1729681 RepID=UPI0025FBDD1F|nr:DegV family protein [uncultured Faecalibaculum sp.]